MRSGQWLRKFFATLASMAMFCASTSLAEESLPRALDHASAEAGRNDQRPTPHKPAGERRAAFKKGARNIHSVDHATGSETDGAYIEVLADGGYEVSWPGGCLTRYDRRGRPTFYGESCDDPKIIESQDIVDSYRR